MKNKDLTLIVVVGVVSAVFAIVLSKVIIKSPETKPQEVEVIQAINPGFNRLDTDEDKRYFNNTAINPTQLIDIKENANNKPFN